MRNVIKKIDEHKTAIMLATIGGLTGVIALQRLAIGMNQILLATTVDYVKSLEKTDEMNKFLMENIN